MNGASTYDAETAAYINPIGTVLLNAYLLIKYAPTSPIELDTPLSDSNEDYEHRFLEAAEAANAIAGFEMED
ncbi:hypothetical protein CH063_05364 [Colletotrichum higginsianum]|nr:hypothetical protein CH063_05364 [Colletotrichum higginsianum]